MTEQLIKKENIHLSVRTELTGDDLITVAVAEKEQQLRNRKKLLEKDVDEAQKKAAKLTKELDKITDNYVEEKYKDKIKTLIGVLKDLGHNVNGAKCIYKGMIDIKSNAISPLISYTDPIDYDRLFEPKDIKLPKEIKNKYTERETVIDEIDTLSKELKNVCMDLRDINSFERQAKAAFVKNLIKESGIEIPKITE